MINKLNIVLALACLAVALNLLANFMLYQSVTEDIAREQKYRAQAQEQLHDAIAECAYLSQGYEDCVQFVTNPTGDTQ